MPKTLVELFGGCGLTVWYGHRNAYLCHCLGPGDTPETNPLGTNLSGYLRRFHGGITPYGEEDMLVMSDTSPEYLSGPQTEVWISE